jgi:hypothetical protein
MCRVGMRTETCRLRDLNSRPTVLQSVGDQPNWLSTGLTADVLTSFGANSVHRTAVLSFRQRVVGSARPDAWVPLLDGTWLQAHSPWCGPMGSTGGYNGQPAPYGRCVIDPCSPYGYICWRNPQKPTPPSAQLRDPEGQGCEAEPNCDIYCSRDQVPHAGPPVPPSSTGGGMFKSKCHVVGSGVQCDPNGPGGDQFAGGDSPQRPSDVYAGGTQGGGGPPPGKIPPPPGCGAAHHGRIRASPGGGYDFCNNPPGTYRPPGCICGVDGGPPPLRPVNIQPIDTAPAPCDMPALQDLALPPDNGDVAVAYALPPEGGATIASTAVRGAFGRASTATSASTSRQTA